jgi:hypothetical protein
MVRSMASIVSALSSGVANGHQTLHLVSSAPSKIPYGGFSPVRLQTRFEPRPPSRGPEGQTPFFSWKRRFPLLGLGFAKHRWPFVPDLISVYCHHAP